MATNDTYTQLLRQSGWKLRNHGDLSKQFLETLQAKLANEIKYAESLERLLGKDEAERGLTRR